MTKSISDSQPPKCLHTPEEAAESPRVKLPWLYQRIRSCSAGIRYLGRGVTRPSFCTTASERVYITAIGCET